MIRHTRAYLKKKKHLRYVPRTGHFWWKLPKQGRDLARPAGRRTTRRYITISVDYRAYSAQHLAWLFVRGVWPSREIDHKNRRRYDNRWCNLRLATCSQNHWNASLRKDNSSGYKGVSWHAPRNKWRARFIRHGKEIHLGLFTTKIAASRAYRKAVIQHRGMFAYY